MRVWLDDVRTPPPDYDIWVKKGEHCAELLKLGLVGHLSFDHDLGLGRWSGQTVALLVEQWAKHQMIRPFTWDIHSMNPVGRDNILATMRSVERLWCGVIEDGKRKG